MGDLRTPPTKSRRRTTLVVTSDRRRASDKPRTLGPPSLVSLPDRVSRANFYDFGDLFGHLVHDIVADPLVHQCEHCSKSRHGHTLDHHRGSHLSGIPLHHL